MVRETMLSSAISIFTKVRSLPAEMATSSVSSTVVNIFLSSPLDVIPLPGILFQP